MESRENKPKVFVLDTNVLLHSAQSVESFQDNDVVIPMAVVEELDKFKKNSDELGRNARQVIRYLDRLRQKALPKTGAEVEDFVHGIADLGAKLGPLVWQFDAGLKLERESFAAFCEAYDVAPEASANCVVVFGRRGEDSVHAAVLVLATDKADVNKTVRKELGMRKMSFADQPTAEALTGMTQGGITPVGLPVDWPILIDEAVVSAGPVVIGGGARGAKLLVDGAELAALPNARVLALALPI